MTEIDSKMHCKKAFYEVHLMNCDDYIYDWLIEHFSFGTFHYLPLDRSQDLFSHYCYFDYEEDAVLCQLVWG